MTILPVGFLSDIGGGEVLVIFVVFLMLFGAKKLPGIARSLGKSMEEFRRAARDVREEFLNADREPDKPSTPTYTPTPSAEPTSSPTDGYEYPGEYGMGDGSATESAPIEPVTASAADAGAPTAETPAEPAADGAAAPAAETASTPAPETPALEAGAPAAAAVESSAPAAEPAAEPAVVPAVEPAAPEAPAAEPSKPETGTPDAGELH